MMRPMSPSHTSRSSTTRRQFLVASSLASAGMLVPRSSWAMPAGAWQPAPEVAPPSAARAAEALAASRTLADEATAKAALEAAVAAGATYADARLVLYREESIGVRDDHVRSVARSDHYGLGVRVIAGGGWGFAATSQVTAKAAVAAAMRAVETAKRNGAMLTSLGKPPVSWAPLAEPSSGTWVAPHEIDPLGVPIQEKADLLLAATQAMLKEPGVQYADGSLSIVVEDKLFLSSEGLRIHQIAPRVLPTIAATAVDRRRGGFAERLHDAPGMQGGWEYVLGLDLPGIAAPLALQAKQKLYARSVEPGTRQVILAPSNLWLTIHESVGHPTELDRAMGLESNFAGTSFLGPNDAGGLSFGSKLVNFVADRTQPGGLATIGWDDDGVAGQRWDLVRDGIFVGWQTTRDQAAWIGESESRGCSYGQRYDGVPFQRMPNVSLQPGREGYTTEDLVNATEDGILIEGRGSWSIDQQRYNFQFSGQMFWEVKRGRITQPLRDVAYQANTLEFWHSCDMLGGEGTYRLGGTFYDGKGEPMQLNAMSHGCPPGRFTVNVVNTSQQRGGAR